MRFYAAALLLGFIGCGDDTIAGQPADLSASMPLDLAAPVDATVPSDLNFGPNYDLALGCPRLAGTCVETFFESFASCFHPAGHCLTVGHNLGTIGLWNNCAYYIDTAGFGGVSHDYYQDGHACLTWTESPTQSSPDQSQSSPDQFCQPGSSCIDGRVQGTSGGATYDSQTGIFTCPDGTVVDIGTNYGDCAPLHELLTPVTSLCDRAGASTCGYPF